MKNTINYVINPEPGSMLFDMQIRVESLYKANLKKKISELEKTEDDPILATIDEPYDRGYNQALQDVMRLLDE